VAFLLIIGAITGDYYRKNCKFVLINKTGKYQFIQNKKLVDVEINITPILDKDKR